jgi:hypothetical protein
VAHRRRLKKRAQKATTPLVKVLNFLEEHFTWMTIFLRHEHVQRNSLAETGMRVLRRLEIEHDGFRSENGREDFLRIYQAIDTLAGLSTIRPT